MPTSDPSDGRTAGHSSAPRYLVLTEDTLCVLAALLPYTLAREALSARSAYAYGRLTSNQMRRIRQLLNRACDDADARNQACYRVSPWGLFAARQELKAALAKVGNQPAVAVYMWDPRRDGAPPPFAPPEACPCRDAHTDGGGQQS